MVVRFLVGLKVADALQGLTEEIDRVVGASSRPGRYRRGEE